MPIYYGTTRRIFRDQNFDCTMPINGLKVVRKKVKKCKKMRELLPFNI